MASTSANPLYMPPELIEHIISYIAHRPTLRACSLTASAFTYRSQQALFREVVLSPPLSRYERHTPAHRFLKTLKSSPHIAAFVHSLIIECEDSSEVQPWLYTDDALQYIFPMLPNLTKISVNGRIQPNSNSVSTKADLSWNLLSSTLRTALASIIRSGSVSDLELGGFRRIPVSSVIDACSKLKKLSLLPLYLADDSPLPQDGSSTEEAAPNRVHLEDIRIKQSAVALRRTADWFSSPTCQLDVGELKSIHFEVATLEDHRQVSRIVEVCAQTLEHLELSPGKDINTIHHLVPKPNEPAEFARPTISLDALRSMKSLKINSAFFMSKMNNKRFSDPLPWIEGVLSTLPEENELSEIELSFDLGLTKSVLQQVSWSDLSATLSSKKFAKNLKNVILTFPTSNKGTPEERLFWVRDILHQNDHLSPLLIRGLVELSI